MHEPRGRARADDDRRARPPHKEGDHVLGLSRSLGSYPFLIDHKTPNVTRVDVNFVTARDAGSFSLACAKCSVTRSTSWG